MHSAGFFVLLSFIFGMSFHAEARVSHVSINKSQFTLGEYPRLQMNVVSERGDFSRLSFYIRQGKSEEKLMAEPVNNFLVLLTGVEDVTDESAELVIREYVINEWQDYKVIPLFGGTERLVARRGAVSEESAKESKPKPTQAKVDTTVVDNSLVAAAEFVKSEAEQSADSVARAAFIESNIEANTEANLEANSVEAKTEFEGLTDSSQVDPESITAATVTSTSVLGDDGCQVEYKQGETLWRIASHYGPVWNANVYGTMLALHDTNPEAFIAGKISGMKQGATFDCPSPAVLSRYPDTREARKQFEARQAL